jgi:hypothetical protein
LEGEGPQGIWNRENDVKIGDRQEVLEPVVQPAVAKGRLAFGAVAVAAGIIGDALMAAGIAGVNMSAQVSGAAMGNGVEDFVLQGGQRKRPAKRVAMPMDDVRQFPGRLGRRGFGDPWW